MAFSIGSFFNKTAVKEDVEDLVEDSVENEREQTKRLEPLTDKKELAIHRLKGEHEWLTKSKDLDEKLNRYVTTQVCQLCGQENKIIDDTMAYSGYGSGTYSNWATATQIYTSTTNQPFVTTASGITSSTGTVGSGSSIKFQYDET